MQIIRARAGSTVLQAGQTSVDIPIGSSFYIEFSAALDTTSAKENIFLSREGFAGNIAANISFLDQNKTAVLSPIEPLSYQEDYSLIISENLNGDQKESFPGIEFDLTTEQGRLLIEEITLNGLNMSSGSILKGIAFDELELVVRFNEALNPENYAGKFSFFPSISYSLALSEDQKTVTITNDGELDYYTKFRFIISSALVSAGGYEFDGFMRFFVTGLNPSQKFPTISDDELLTLVQQQTFKYFWDYAHPVSGLTRERYLSGETVTIGGSGFGLMAILVGIERNFITRQEGISRLNTIIDFLGTADRHHGAWPHWMNGTSGQTIPFGSKDDGGDLVETSFMAAGLLTVRQYLDSGIPFENEMIGKINNLLGTIEWDWYTRGGQDVLYWHWSPNYNWDMNMQVRGYNEALITYFMAATSTTYPIAASVYHKGWANEGGIINGQSYYGIELPVGYAYGGPLFFAHYSFMGLNPQNLSDQYANYWVQNVNHSLINRQHCIFNPAGHLGYGEDAWGLTASDDPEGYAVHEPTRDNGTLTPTAALSSMPFTPAESMDALRHFYYTLGDKLWGPYGFYDAFNPGEGWWADSYLAIDQGPIVVMIENYRSGLCWDLFMSAPEVDEAMNKLGISN
ncbi:MAG: glucoamylase family protein [Bacteroides sp.]|nr:glucoamylase family protein [Bacteroides sp.]